MTEPYPLFARFPALATIPRVELCTLPTPVVHAGLAAPIWIKNDALSAAVAGGNKVRALEFLLAGVRPGDTVLTVGGEGSTQVLATAIHAARLGARTIAVRWRHEMNATATRVGELSAERCERAAVRMASPIAMAEATLIRVGAALRSTRRRSAARLHYVPMGAATPLGILGIVNGALELAEQIRRGDAPTTDRIVVALGSGGTMAGLALGAAIADIGSTIVGVQVTPRLVANPWRVRRLVERTARLIECVTGERVRRPDARQMVIHRGAYAGAYGRANADAVPLAEALARATGIRLDQTYSAKALAGARNVTTKGGDTTLLWNTFDARLLDPG